MSNFTKDILHMKFQNFTCVFTILMKFDIYFLEFFGSNKNRLDIKYFGNESMIS